MSFTPTPVTAAGGWSPRTPTNWKFTELLADACNDAYVTGFSRIEGCWRIYTNTGVVEYKSPGEPWTYVGRLDNAGQFVADAASDPHIHPHTADGVYDDGVDASTGCCGHGLFFNGGASVNGKYTGTIGECFPCAGKGYQTRQDRTRNAVYNAKYRRVYA